MNSRRHGRSKKLQFLIRWEGYSPAHDSWEDAADVHAPEKLEEYYQRKRTAIRALEYKSTKDSSTTSSPSSLPSSEILACTPELDNILDTGLPLHVSATSFMQHHGEQHPTSTVPIDA